MKLFIAIIALFIFLTIAPNWLINIVGPISLIVLVWGIVMAVKAIRK